MGSVVDKLPLEELEAEVVALNGISSQIGQESRLDSETPVRLFSLLVGLSSLRSRADAERLQELGVTLWNTTLLLDGRTLQKTSDRDGCNTKHTLVKLRHIAVDCMNMGSSCLGGLSSKYEIDTKTLLKFYSACGAKYLDLIQDTSSAEICFAKAAEFADQLEAETEEKDPAHSKAMFDLLVGQAQCAYHRQDLQSAFQIVRQAKEFISSIPLDTEYLASLQFNFGLYLFQASQKETALEWLLEAYETRACRATQSFVNSERQASTCRLLGLIYSETGHPDEAEKFLELSNQLLPHFRTRYLLLKLTLEQSSDANQVSSRLAAIFDDQNASTEVLLSTFGLLLEAHCYSAVVDGCRAVVPRLLSSAIDRTHILLFKCRAELAMNQMESAQLTMRTSMAEAITSRSLTTEQRRDTVRNWVVLGLNVSIQKADLKDYENAVSFGNLVCGLSFGAGLSTVTSSDERSETFDIRNFEIPIRMLVATTIVAWSTSANSLPPEKRKTILENSALGHTSRVQELDSTHVEAKILHFRILLLIGRNAEAIEAIEGILCEDIKTERMEELLPVVSSAIRDAKDAECERGILNCLESLVSSNIQNLPIARNGFLGQVLVSVVGFSIDQGNGGAPKLLRLLSRARDLCEILGAKSVFGSNEGLDHALPKALADSAWNQGKLAGDEGLHELSFDFLELARYFMGHQEQTLETLRSQRVACLLQATVLMAAPSIQGDGPARKGLLSLADARRLGTQILQLSRTLADTSGTPAFSNDSCGGLIQILTVKAASKLKLSEMLEDEVSSILKSPGTTIRLLTQVGTILLSDQNSILSSSLLRLVFAMVVRMLETDCQTERSEESFLPHIRENLAHLRIWVQHLVSIRSATESSDIVTLLARLMCNYPGICHPFEVRWLASKAWEVSQLLFGQGLHLESTKWAQICRRICAESDHCCGLRVCIENVDQFLEQCRRVVTSAEQ